MNNIGEGEVTGRDRNRQWGGREGGGRTEGEADWDTMKREKEASAGLAACLGSVSVIVSRWQRGYGGVSRTLGAAVLRWWPCDRAYVTSLARTRALPLLGHTSLAPSVTVPMRPWCANTLVLFFGEGGGKWARKGLPLVYVWLFQGHCCSTRPRIDGGGGAGEELWRTSSTSVWCVSVRGCESVGNMWWGVHVRVFVNQHSVMHTYQWVQDTGMEMITAFWEGGEGGEGKTGPGSARCSRVESR